MNAASITEDLTEYFAGLLRVPRDGIDVSANLLDLGADSIMLLEARGWIETRYGRRIDIPRFFDDLGSLAAIATHLAETAAPSSPPPSVTASRSRIAGSDLALLRAQLALVGEVIETQNRSVAGLAHGAAPRAEPAAPLAESSAS